MMAKGRKTGGRRRGTRNKATVLREEAIREALRAEGDVPDGPELTPLEIMVRCANRLYSKAVHARSQGNFALEEALLKLAASAAEKAAPYTSPRMPAVVVGPNTLPSIKRMTTAQLRQLLIDLGEGDYEDITDQEAQDKGQPLEGPQAQPPNGSSKGSRPRS